MSRNIIYVSDELPAISATLSDAAGVAINLTGITVKFGMRRAYDTANLFKNTAVVVSATLGTVRYDITSSDLTTAAPGTYWAQWELTRTSDSFVEHIDAGEFEIRVGL